MAYFANLARGTGLRYVVPGEARVTPSREPSGHAVASPLELEQVRFVPPASPDANAPATQNLDAHAPPAVQPSGCASGAQTERELRAAGEETPLTVPSPERAQTSEPPGSPKTATAPGAGVPAPTPEVFELELVPEGAAELQLSTEFPSGAGPAAQEEVRIAPTVKVAALRPDPVRPEPISLRDVRQWLAGSTEEEAVTAGPRALPEAEGTRLPMPGTAGSTTPLERTEAEGAAATAVENFTLSIGSIHVTVEEPAAPAPWKASPPVVPKPTTGDDGASSRLSRHYLTF